MLSNYPFASFYLLLFVLFVAIFYRPILRLVLLLPKTDKFVRWLVGVFSPIQLRRLPPSDKENGAKDDSSQPR